MTTARIAVTISVILSLFLLSAHAGHPPHLPDESSSNALAVPENIEDHRTAVLLPHERSSSSDDNSIPAVDLSSQISHSLRLPINRHTGFGRPWSIRLHRRGCRHSPLRPRTEIPYGNDMIPSGGFSAKKRRPFKIRASPSVSREEFRKMVEAFAVGAVDADGREIWKKEVRPWNPKGDWEVVDYEKKKKEEEKEDDDDEIEHEKKEDEEEEELKHKRKKMMKKMRKEREEREEGGLMKRVREFLNRF